MVRAHQTRHRRLIPHPAEERLPRGLHTERLRLLRTPPHRVQGQESERDVVPLQVRIRPAQSTLQPLRVIHETATNSAQPRGLHNQLSRLIPIHQENLFKAAPKLSHTIRAKTLHTDREKHLRLIKPLGPEHRTVACGDGGGLNTPRRNAKPLHPIQQLIARRIINSRQLDSPRSRTQKHAQPRETITPVNAHQTPVR